MRVIVIIEVDPCPLRAAGRDPASPIRQFILRVIVAIPMFRSVQPQVNIVGGSYKFVRKPRPTAAAEDRAGLTKRRVHRLVPPAGVTELNDVPPRWIELPENGKQPRLGIAMTWWKLE